MVPGQIARKEGSMKVVAEITTGELMSLVRADYEPVLVSECDKVMHGGADAELIGGEYTFMVRPCEYAFIYRETGEVLTHTKAREVFE